MSGHRCDYEFRVGRGPRGGRQTWTTAHCLACGLRVEKRDYRPDACDVFGAKQALEERVPVCPVSVQPSAATRALRDLIAARRAGATAPPLVWAVEYAPDGDLASAIQRAWDGCDDLATAAKALAALCPAARFVRSAASEAGDRDLIGFEIDGVNVDLYGRTARVLAAARALVPRLEWPEAGAAAGT